METTKGYGKNGEKRFPSYAGEFYAAHPEKFEDRKNTVKPLVYGAALVVCVLLVIFPAWIPVLPLWLIRAAAVIGGLYFLLSMFTSRTSTYNKLSGGEVKNVNIKKFIRNETNLDKIVEAFNRHDFEYLTELPSGNNQPVQLIVEEDRVGREFYCLLTTYDSSSNIVGLADPVVLSGSEYEDNEDFIRHMCDNEQD